MKEYETKGHGEESDQKRGRREKKRKIWVKDETRNLR